MSKQEAAAIAQGRHPMAADLIGGALEYRQTRGAAAGFDQPTTRVAAIDFIKDVAASLSAHDPDSHVAADGGRLAR